MWAHCSGKAGCVWLCLLFCLACSLQLFFFACLNCAGCIFIFSSVLIISRVTSSVGKATVLNCLPLGHWLHWPVGSSAMTSCDFFPIYFFKVLPWQLGIGNRTFFHISCLMGGWENIPASYSQSIWTSLTSSLNLWRQNLTPLQFVP